MTNRERLLLIAGLATGMVLGSLGVVWMLRARQAPSEPGASQPVSAAHEAPAPRENMQSSAGDGIELSKQEQDAIGLRTIAVTRRTLTSELRTAGRVEQAETQLATISSRVAGRIDKLYIDFTGQPVRRGQPIASIYSPQVVASAEEYKLALRARRNLGPDAHAQAVTQADDLIAASRRRLELWGLASGQIEKLATSDQLIHVITYSTVKGIVTEKKVAEGQYVQEGQALYSVNDLSSVWVLADVYEADLGSVRVGQTARVEMEALPGASLRGTVSFIDPSVNASTRTASVRIQLPNPDMKLRPGMFVHVALNADSSSQLAIPRSAVLDTGERKVVFVARDEGAFERREVELGPASGGDYLSIRKGLKEGEHVVTNGAFLIDSQTRVSGGMSGMFGGSMDYAAGKTNGSSEKSAAKPSIDLRFDPNPLQSEKAARVFVDVRDASGQAVSDASVSITFLMPAMPSMGMAEMRNTYPLKWDGKQYSGEVQIRSAGPWTVTVDVTKAGQRIATKRTQATAR